MKKTSVATKTSKQKTNKVLAILTLCTIAITAIIIGQFLVLDNTTNKILHDGTVINGLNLSGMSKDEAKVMLLSNFQEKASDFELNIKDSTSDKNWKFDGDDLKVNSDIHTILEASQDEDSLLGKETDTSDFLAQFNKKGGSINVSFNYIFTGLDEKIESILNEVEIEPVNSKINFTPDNKNPFDITESVNGKRVNKQKLYNDINEQFLTSNKINVELSYTEEIPAITKEYNESLTKKIATFSTNVADSTGGRKHNVKLALSKFNGFVLNPNETVSFNTIIGEHTTQNGYKPATLSLIHI